MDLKKMTVTASTVYAISFSLGFNLAYIGYNVENMSSFPHAEYWLPRIFIRFFLCLLTGPLYGFFFYRSLKKRQVTALGQLPAGSGSLQFDQPAGLARPKAIAGWILLTDNILVFAATRYKDVAFTRTIALTDILQVVPQKSAFRPKLQLFLADNSVIEITASKPEIAAEKINTAVAARKLQEQN